ncbi:hypothetical protein LJC16_02780 [Bacteroidales bacterium OttesenSCG-928-C19]|nr:hypothetical protein [Bacteroidales bacterium OttesenSCG-928-C19]
MKQILSFGLLLAMLILSATLDGSSFCKNNSSEGNTILIDEEYATLNFPQKEHLQIIAGILPCFVRVHKPSSSKSGKEIIKTINTLCRLLFSYRAQQTSRQLLVVQTERNMLYSQKEMNGYYIYTLQKLRN